MQHDDTIRILYILEAARKALHFVENRRRGDLDREEIWKKMIELRNRLIHGYFDINLDIVWDTVLEDLPPLVADLEKIIPHEELP